MELANSGPWRRPTSPCNQARPTGSKIGFAGSSKFFSIISAIEGGPAPTSRQNAISHLIHLYLGFCAWAPILLELGAYLNICLHTDFMQKLHPIQHHICLQTRTHDSFASACVHAYVLYLSLPIPQIPASLFLHSDIHASTVAWRAASEPPASPPFFCALECCGVGCSCCVLLEGTCNLKATCASAGTIPKSDITDWSSLPWEMQDLIFGKLSLHELARASRTCRSFQTVFTTKLGEEQKGRLDLAGTCFSEKQIECIAAFAARFFKRETAVRNLDRDRKTDCRISADGEWQVERSRPARRAHQRPAEEGDIRIRVSFLWASPTIMEIGVHVPGRAWVDLHVCGGQGMIAICVTPYGDEAVEGVALVQALVTWALPRRLRDHSPHAYIMVQECPERVQQAHGRRHSFTIAGMRAQIAPLLPLLAKNAKLRIGGWGRPMLPYWRPRRQPHKRIDGWYWIF